MQPLYTEDTESTRILCEFQELVETKDKVCF